MKTRRSFLKTIGAIIGFAAFPTTSPEVESDGNNTHALNETRRPCINHKSDDVEFIAVNLNGHISRIPVYKK